MGGRHGNRIAPTQGKCFIIGSETSSFFSMFFDLNHPGGRLFGIFLGHLGYLGQKKTSLKLAAGDDSSQVRSHFDLPR